MWKRDETTPSASIADATPKLAKSVKPISGAPEPRSGSDVVNIGRSVVIKGELSGSEDLTIEGQVDGKIELKDHLLTVGPNGRIKAEIMAKSVIVMGQVTGNVRATEKIYIRENGAVEGDVSAPRVAIAEGAHFKGTIDMSDASPAVAQPSRSSSRSHQDAPRSAAASAG